jgi:hypothetical protein
MICFKRLKFAIWFSTLIVYLQVKRGAAVLVADAVVVKKFLKIGPGYYEARRFFL